MTASRRLGIYAAKLSPPLSGEPARVLARARLDGFADRLGTVRLAVVCGPAGIGKTTVLARWHAVLKARGFAVAWLSLDAGDGDGGRFFQSVACCLEPYLPGFADVAGAGSGPNRNASLADALAPLVERVAASGRPLALFLDDYHHVADPAVHRDLALLVQYLPPGSVLVLGSRSMPPLPLARLRARGELLELRWDDLRFTPDETRAFLEAAGIPGLPEDAALRLAERTEGWAAGLQLAVLSLRGRDGALGRVAGFSGCRADVADYLLEEVYCRQPDEIRRFLLRTSVLERLSGPLCDAVTGGGDSRSLLDRLDRANLFVSRLDEHRHWYRYHHLFGEFLAHRLAVEEPGAEAGLHLRASLWFEAEGNWTTALDHAIAGGWHARAAGLVATHGRDLFRRSDFRELRGWIERLPPDLVRGRAELCALHAWALAYLGEFGTAHAAIASALDGLAGAGPAADRIDAELRVLRATLGVIQTDEPVTDGLDESVTAHFAETDAVLRAFTDVMLGYALRHAGNLSGAEERCRRSIARSDDAGASLVNLLARFNLATVLRLGGRLGESERLVLESLAVVSRRGWTGTIGSAFLHVALGCLLQDRNRPAEAVAALDEAVAALEATQAHGFLGVALVERARALHMAGRRGEADRELAAARLVAERHNVARVRFRADLAEIRFAADMGDLAAGAAAVARVGSHGSAQFVDADAGLFAEKHESFLVEHLRLMLAGGQHAELIRLSGAALRSAAAAGRRRHAVDFLALRAAAWRGLGDLDRAVRKLEQALALMGGEIAVRPFLLPNGDLVPLLGMVEGPDAAREAAAHLLEQLGRQATGTAPDAAEAGAGAGGAEAGAHGGAELHHRELQILRLVSEGLRNREVAERLLVSEETVKWYLKKLYSKLDVTTRTSAVARGRELGLLT